jgi:DNA invertase Pin-like site-specific DNA recombinase
MAQFGPSAWMEKATPLIYTRVSTNDQDPKSAAIEDRKKKPILIKQFDLINNRLKQAGLKKGTKENWFAEVASGTNRKRSQWAAIQQRAISMANDGQRVYIAVKDPSRWARNNRHSMVAIDTLHDFGIPVFSASEGIQTGSVNDLHPTEELIFMQLSGSSAYVSQIQKEKADASVETSKKEGTLAAKQLSLFPFAKRDPLDVYLENVDVLLAPAKEGVGGPKAFGSLVANLTAPKGPSVSTVKDRMRRDETARRANLSPAEYKKWRLYRDKIRNILIKRKSDPWAKNTDSGKYDFGSQALMMMAGRSLVEPWEYRERSDKEINEYLKNPKPYLSVKDSKIWRNIVSKR